MSDSIDQVREWIAEAYADGVPDADAAALMVVLRRRVGDAEAYRLAFDLAGVGLLSAAAAVDTGNAEPSDGDVRRVSAALVLGGWPLSGRFASASDDEDSDTEPGSYLGRIVAWLREGYPYGVPDHDYQPLLAILERRLTRGEVKRVAKALRRSGAAPAGPEDIAAAIVEVTHTEASDTDLRRVRDRLAKKGWPVEFPDPDLSEDQAPDKS
ncbi:MAG: DUF3349 domain-containing protein [Nostocoides sp.]